MIHHFAGEIRQLGYVVRDIEDAMSHWSGVLGVGPWFYLERFPVEDFRYKGKPSPAAFSIALANSGGLQVELVAPLDEAPSMYRDFLARGNEGLQHLGFWAYDIDKDLNSALEAGYAIGQSGNTKRGPFYYLETEDRPDNVIELIAMNPERERFCAAVEAAARDWDGREPIRHRWPTVT